MLAHYSHVRIGAKRKAFDAVAEDTQSKGYVTKHVHKTVEGAILNLQPLKRMAGTTGLARGLCRHRLDGFGFSATYILAGAAKSPRLSLALRPTRRKRRV